MALGAPTSLHPREHQPVPVEQHLHDSLDGIFSFRRICRISEGRQNSDLASQRFGSPRILLAQRYVLFRQNNVRKQRIFQPNVTIQLPYNSTSSRRWTERLLLRSSPRILKCSESIFDTFRKVNSWPNSHVWTSIQRIPQNASNASLRADSFPMPVESPHMPSSPSRTVLAALPCQELHR